MTEAELALLPYIEDIPDDGSLFLFFPEQFFITQLGSWPYIPDVDICASNDGGSGGGSDGPCEDDRPNTGMLYPRG